MLRLLGILSLGHLIFGGRHHRLRRGILFGVLLGYLANRDFNAERVAEDVREKAGKARRAAREAVRAAEKELRTAEHDRRIHEIHEKVDARRAAREERMNALHAEIEARKAARKAETKQQEVYALPVSGLNEARRSGSWRRTWSGIPVRQQWPRMCRPLISRKKRMRSISPPGSTAMYSKTDRESL